MQNNIISKITPSVRMICLFILCISLFMAKSIFLILFITILTLMLTLISGKKVNQYVNIIRKVYILLLILGITYIIMFGCNVFNWLIFAYKLTIVILLFSVFYFNTDVNQFHQSIYGCLRPLEKLKINVKSISFDILMSLFFLKSLMDNIQKLNKIQKMYGKRQLNLKNYIMPIFINSANDLNEFQCNLKTKFYKLSYQKNNMLSKFILVVFVSLFILVIFKEVILCDFL